MQNRFQDRDQNQPRINFQIRAYNVRVIQEGKQLGVMPIEQARRIAGDAGLDLVEIVAHAQPPVCEIKDFGRWVFDEKIKQKEQARKQRESQGELKEIRLRPAIAAGDIATKVGQARKFIEEGKKVQFYLLFKGQRELSHREIGFDVINKVVADLADVCTPEKAPKMEGNRIIVRLNPLEKK